MSTLRVKDRVSLCTFTFADGRRCRTPRSDHHPHPCFDHARREAQARAADDLGRDFSYFFSGQYLSACDLSAALGRLFVAVAQGQFKPKTASTLAYLAQTLLQTIHLAQDEYINAFGTGSWRHVIASSVNANHDHTASANAPSAPVPHQPAPSQPVGSAFRGAPPPPSTGPLPQPLTPRQPSPASPAVARATSTPPSPPVSPAPQSVPSSPIPPTTTPSISPAPTPPIRPNAPNSPLPASPSALAEILLSSVSPLPTPPSVPTAANPFRINTSISVHSKAT